jgi:hypothetical protein
MPVMRAILGIAAGLAVTAPLAWLLFGRMKFDWFGSHLRELPIERIRYLLAARFLRMASVGFLVDVVLGGRMTRPLVLLFAFLFGLTGPAVLLLRQRSPFQRLLVVMPIVFALYMIAIVHGHGNLRPSAASASAFRFDAFAIFLTALASAFVTTSHINTEGARQDRAEMELEAARAVQQVLIPDEIPNLPGFRIESEYRPAGQVGGDFFQILPTAEGGILAAIGDVSGKGMPAAMTVSMLVGALRTLAHSKASPGEILTEINRSMVTHSQDGFTTCLVLRADADGSVTAANAGHLNPYRNGEEVELNSGLPLGIAAGGEYAEQRMELEPGDTLTLLSDGVVEARDARGALFGFERTRAISRRAAAEIAEAAQEFGQEDDITVLSITRIADVAAEGRRGAGSTAGRG